MNLSILIIFTPLMTAAIGWLTNWVAIKMLFHPRQPINLLFFKWQGLIPRRQKELAVKTAEIIESEILQQHSVLNELRRIELGPHLEEATHRIVRERIGPQLKAIPLLGSFINEDTLTKLEGLAVQEMKNESTLLMENIANQFESSVDLKQMIEANIIRFELEHLEAIVNQVARIEFRTIERLGALLGFMIGSIQVFLFLAIGAIRF